MKNLIFACIILFALQSSAQNFIRITGATYAGFNGQPEHSFDTEVDRVKRGAFMSHWESYIKANASVKPEVSEHSILLKKATFKKLGSHVFNLYIYFEDMVDGVRMHVGFEDTLTGFVSIDDPRYGVSIYNLIKDESTKVYYQAKSEDLKAEKNYLKNLEKNYKGIQKKVTGYEKTIQSNNIKISRLQDEISISRGVIDDITSDIASQRGNLNTNRANMSSETKRALEKEIKAQEKKRSKLHKDIEKMNKAIFKIEANNRDCNFELDKAQHDADLEMQKIVNQRELVSALKEHIPAKK